MPKKDDSWWPQKKIFLLLESWRVIFLNVKILQVSHLKVDFPPPKKRHNTVALWHYQKVALFVWASQPAQKSINPRRKSEIIIFVIPF